ncbi:MAG: ATP-dependent DNA helicase [Candidatus Methylacidiphilales bacterium]
MIAPLNSLESRVRALFDEGSVLTGSKHYEHRPQQIDMAAAVARALSEERHLLVEAGTGVGKSLAYLLPALCHAEETRKKALISTYTIQLQEQLFHKDIPLAQKILPFEFKAALLKGRQNYVCPARLKRAIAQRDDLFTSSEHAELQRIHEWLQTTADGTLSDFNEIPNPKIWSQICSEPHLCTPRSCGHDPKCFYQQARKKMLDARLIVLNHTLFFTCLGGMDEHTDAGQGFMFQDDFVVFDEAHRLADVAARHIGISINPSSMRYQLQRLYHPNTRKGLLNSLRRADAQQEVVNLIDEIEMFFARVREASRIGEKNEIRIRTPELVEDTLSLPLMRLRGALMDTASGTDDETSQLELRDMARRLSEYRGHLKTFLDQEADGHVYWVEKAGRDQLQLQAAPIDLAAVLRGTLFLPGRSAILTSATLSAGQGLKYVQNQLGAEAAETLELDSPFDFPSQMKVIIPHQMPDPREARYEDALVQWIHRLVTDTDGGAFVLFTSYSSLRRAADQLRETFEKHQWPLLAQGEGMARIRMLEEFKQSGRAVLFGTDSFWQGVDVPGQALRNVILTKLPFAVPDHPLIEAKLELIQERGGDPFREYSLPEAILKFRQGIGRLIRTARDHGQVAILDSRILSKPYGRHFMAKLPNCPVFHPSDPSQNEASDHPTDDQRPRRQ